MRFCPPNVTFSDIWQNGVSECFMETVSASVLSSFLLLFGTIQMVIYWRYATLNTTFSRNSSTKLYKFQVFLLILFPILAVARFILWSFVYEKNEILGYKVSCPLNGVMCFNPTVNVVAPHNRTNCDLLSVYICSDVQRTTLPVAFAAQSRAWLGPAGLLDTVVCSGKFVVHQLQERGMVVRPINVS